MKITNLPTILKFLKNEIKDHSDVTQPLTVMSVDDSEDSVTVASSVDADLLIKIRGVKKVYPGSTVTIDVKTGDLKPVGAAVTQPPPIKQTVKPQGCFDRSSISR